MYAGRLGELSVGNSVERQRLKARLRIPSVDDFDSPTIEFCVREIQAAKRHGAEQVIHVIDCGVPKWERLGHPVESGDQPARQRT